MDPSHATGLRDKGPSRGASGGCRRGGRAHGGGPQQREGPVGPQALYPQMFLELMAQLRAIAESWKHME